MHLIEHGVGVNAWREKVSDGLLPEDHLLRTEGTKPPSKPHGDNTGQSKGLWFYLHMTMLLPALEKLRAARTNPTLQTIPLTPTERTRLVGHYDTVKTHMQQFMMHYSFLFSVPDNLPDHEDDLEESYRTLLQNEIAGNDNHLVGRVLQAYYATRANIGIECPKARAENYVRYGLPRQTDRYFKGGRKNLFDRTHDYAIKHLPNSPFSTAINFFAAYNHFTLADAAGFYVWLSNKYVVEMITPEFLGAASEAGERLADMLDYIYDTTGGQIDYRFYDVPDHIVARILERSDFVERLDLMAEFFDGQAGNSEIAALNIRAEPIAALKNSLVCEKH